MAQTKLKYLYEETYLSDKHFSFGENWKIYLKNLNNKKIKLAEKSLIDFLKNKDAIKNKTFLDLGCGSGLFSLASINLGAKKVVSVDVDKDSVACAQFLKKKYCKNNNSWKIIYGSALNDSLLKKLGKFDIIYSWGVLHHTGDMYKAFKNIDYVAKKGSFIYLAIYNDNRKVLEGKSVFWHKIKKIYNKSGTFVKQLMYQTYKTYLILGITTSGKNPAKYIREYETLRGMNFYTDIKDWLGGYPYQYASVETLTKYFRNRNYSIEKIIKARSIGCNELLLKRKK
ncbi:class I SAM-dependent methyltransferase [Candidatus Woesearchaeota archaeon]|nr:class I SAM-dependent methyltransferase [Candidatus Woesearchaeota archaeon]